MVTVRRVRQGWSFFILRYTVPFVFVSLHLTERSGREVEPTGDATGRETDHGTKGADYRSQKVIERDGKEPSELE